MKKLALIVIGILMLAGCDAPAMNYEVKDNGPDGFYGLKWKSTVKQAVENGIIYPIALDTKFRDFAGIGYKPIRRMIGDVQMGQFSNMSFYKNQFYQYYGVFKGEGNYDTLRTALLEKYGDPDKQELKNIFWKFNNSIMTLDYDPENDSGILLFAHERIFIEVLKVNKTQSDL